MRAVVGCVVGATVWVVAGVLLFVLVAGDCESGCRPTPGVDVLQRVGAATWLSSPILAIGYLLVRRARADRTTDAGRSS